MHEGITGVGVRVVRVKVLKVRLPLQRGFMVPKMVGQAMAALLPPGELHLATASEPAAASRPFLTPPIEPSVPSLPHKSLVEELAKPARSSIFCVMAKRYRAGVVRIWILGRNGIRIHADPSYLITDNSIS